MDWCKLVQLKAATARQVNVDRKSLGVVSTEGLLIYSLDDVVMVDPFDLTIDRTPVTVKEALINKEYTAALCIVQFCFNDYKLVSQATEAVPVDDSKQ